MAMGDLWASLTTARPCPRTALPPIFSDRGRQLSRTLWLSPTAFRKAMWQGLFPRKGQHWYCLLAGNRTESSQLR